MAIPLYVPFLTMTGHHVQAGAKHVYGIERSAIADQATLIVKDNGYSDRVTIIKGGLRVWSSA